MKQISIFENIYFDSVIKSAVVLVINVSKFEVYEKELSCSTPPNVWPHDGDIFVPVKAGLLVHKAQSMHEFMGYHSQPEAVRVLEGYSLPSTTSAKVGPTPASTPCIENASV